MTNRSIEFFDGQFRRQIREGQFELNPFERLALPYLGGRVLDLGCGLGNLAIAAARQGCSVVALDASAHAIARIDAVARSAGLAIDAQVADLAAYRIGDEYDAIVAIGLLMFFERPRARELLHDIQAHVRPGGHAVVNTLIEGTTYLDMFEPGKHCLFAADELERAFSGWKICETAHSSFDAPGQTTKRFSTVIAQRR